MLTPVQELILRCFVLEPEDKTAFKMYKKRLRDRGYAASHRVETRRNKRAYRLRHPVTAEKSSRTWRENNRAYQANHGLVRRYGITLEQRAEMLVRQDGKCAICKSVFTKTPHVDHCHRTGVVRGLLCSPCNSGLGCFRDSVESCLRAGEYLNAACK